MIIGLCPALFLLSILFLFFSILFRFLVSILVFGLVTILFLFLLPILFRFCLLVIVKSLGRILKPPLTLARRARRQHPSDSSYHVDEGAEQPP